MKEQLNITEQNIVQEILKRQIDFDNLSELEQAEQDLKHTDNADAVEMLNRVTQILDLCE